jgi:hypothetical protein
LQVAEALCGLQLRVVLRDGQQPPKRLAEGRLGLLKLPEPLGVVEVPGVHLDGGGLRPRLRHRLQRLLLKIGGALHRLHEVGDEVGPPLVGRLQVGPRLPHLLVALDEAVVRARGPAADEAEDNHEDDEGDGAFASHGRGIFW